MQQLRARVQRELAELSIDPNTAIGQHFLVDSEVVSLMTAGITRQHAVLEVGPGFGHLSERILQFAGALHAVEIDPRFEPKLRALAARVPSFSFEIQNALDVGFAKHCLRSDGLAPIFVANLPFHNVEPLLMKLIGLPFERINILVGQQFHRAAIATPESEDFSGLSLAIQSFFHLSELVANISSESFYPPPRVDSCLLDLTPFSLTEIAEDLARYLMARLIATSGHGALVKNVLTEGIIRHSVLRSEQLPDTITPRNLRLVMAPRSASQSNALSKNEARKLIDQIRINDTILTRPFAQLNNSQIRELAIGLKQLGCGTA